jgi:hypothetical protein
MSDCAKCGASVYVADGYEFEEGDLCTSCLNDKVDRLQALVNSADEPNGSLMWTSDHEKILARQEEQWKMWGIVEIAVRNPNVASYMEHWENRSVKAEARIGRFIKLLDAASHSLRSYQYGNSAVDLAKGIADSIDKELIL